MAECTRSVLGVRLQFNPIAFGSRYLVMRLLYADDDPDNAGDLRPFLPPTSAGSSRNAFELSLTLWLFLLNIHP